MRRWFRIIIFYIMATLMGSFNKQKKYHVPAVLTQNFFDYLLDQNLSAYKVTDTKYVQLRDPHRSY